MTYEFDRESLIVACNRVEDSARELIEKHKTKMSAVEIISVERLLDYIYHFTFNFRRVPNPFWEELNITVWFTSYSQEGCFKYKGTKMQINHLTKWQVKALLEYSEKYGTIAFNLEPELLPCELCKYRGDGVCRMTGESCPTLSFGCKNLIIKEIGKKY